MLVSQCGGGYCASCNELIHSDAAAGAHTRTPVVAQDQLGAGGQQQQQLQERMMKGGMKGFGIKGGDSFGKTLRLLRLLVCVSHLID